MTDPHLPAQSFEEAIPYLRAPYMASQVQAKILTTPDNPDWPCTIALYAIGETQMDRFTLTCGGQWGHEFTKLVEQKAGAGWYCMVAASFTVFGVTHTDIGEGWAPTRAGAEMNARAQASKRAGRKFGPGQCLYACDPIVMFRGGEPHELRLPKGDDPKRHLKPYFDKEGKGQEYCRNQYDRWVTNTGENIYGPPLDHLKIAEAIRSRGARLVRARTNDPHGNPEAPTSGEPEDMTGQSNASEPHAAASLPAQQHRAMPDGPASASAIHAAESSGYGEAVAKALCNLAANQEQSGPLTESQERVVRNWLTALAHFKVPEAKILDVVALAAKECDDQEARQARLARWLAAKAEQNHRSTPEAGSAAADAPSSEQAPGTTDNTPTQGTESASSQNTGQDANAGSEHEKEDLATARAYVRIHRAMAAHSYDDRAVTLLAALAVGAGPRGHVDWAQVSSDVLEIISEVLEAAASLEWSTETLNKEALKAHERTQQATPAGRFAAFANHLMNAAETRTPQAA
jgi:hypothetical protein